MTKLNPLDIAYDGLIAALFKAPSVRAAIKEGNRIIYDSLNNPAKQNITSADVPELLIYGNGLSGTLHFNADSCKLTTTYLLQISSGSFNSRDVHNLMLSCIVALLNWKKTIHSLTYEGKTFIKDVRINPSPIGTSNADANRQVRGWAALIGIELDLYLNSQSLIDLYNVEN